MIWAEWTKLRTVPSTGWLVVGCVAGMVGLGVAVTSAVNTSHCPSPAECFEDTTKLSLTGVWVGQVAVVILAVLAVTNEYGTGMIKTTLATMPQRIAGLLTTATVVSVIAAVAGTIGVLGSLLAGRIILPGNGFTPEYGYEPLSLSDGPTLRAAVGTVAYLALIAWLSLGIGAIVRDTATAITLALSLLFLFPVIAQFVSDPVWWERLQKLPPMTAGLAIQATANLNQLPISPWAGLGVLAAYAGLTLAAGIAVFTLRDA